MSYKGGGAKTGERRGGRKKGTPNKASVEKAERIKQAAEIAAEVGITREQAQTVLQRASAGRKLARDEVNDTMIPLVLGVIAHLQNEMLLVEPDPDDRTGKTTRAVLKDGRPQIRPGADLVEYRYWTEMLYAMLKDQYPYEAPRFGVFAVGVTPAGLLGFGGQPALDGEVIPSGRALPSPEDIGKMDANSASAAYMRLMKVVNP